MNSFKMAVAAMALALAAGCDIGTNPANTAQGGARPGPAPDAVETDIKRLEQMEAKAFLERDVATLSKLWDAKYVVNNPDNKIVADVSPEKRPGLQKPRTLFTREVEHLSVRGDLVISMGGETIVPGDGEPHASKTVHRRYTHIWQLVEGEWKLIARHANVFRVDPSLEPSDAAGGGHTDRPSGVHGSSSGSAGQIGC